MSLVSIEARLESNSSEKRTSKSKVDADNINEENITAEDEKSTCRTDESSESIIPGNKNETYMMVLHSYGEAEELSDLVIENEESFEETQSDTDINSVLSNIKIIQNKNSNDRLLFYCEKCDLYDDTKNIERHIKFHNPKIKLEKIEEKDTESDIIGLFDTQETNQEQSFIYEMQQEDTILDDVESSTDNNENGLDCESKIQMSVILSENANENGLLVIDDELLDKQCEEANEEDMFVTIVYRCQQCIKAFVTMEKLKEHVAEKHHGTIDDKLCSLCGFYSDNKENFDEHMENEHSIFSCEFCERTFKSSINRTRHVTKAHHKDVDSLECGICDSSFSTKQELLTHKEVHISGEGRYICPTCGTTCMTEKYLKSHISNSHNIGHEFPCEMCHKTFKRKSNRWSHHSNHVYDFPCQHCCNSYNSQFSLECHIASHSAAERTVTRIINCEFQGCDEVFNSKFKYFNHQKMHLNIVEYKCETCLKFFKSESILKNHKKIHESGTVCLICKKNFANQKTLKEHMRLHTGELPFSCTTCGQKFRCQSFLAVHKTTHTGERNYKCSFCTQAFSRSSYLKEHLRTHTNDKPFVCKFCKKGYAQANVLSKHLTTMHRRCPICREVIGDKMKLQVHLWKQHPHKENKGDDEMFILTETEPMLIGEETVVGF